MKSLDVINIVTDSKAFEERVDEITAETSFEDVVKCVSKLKQALYDNTEAAAICAPQIGYDLRLFVVRTARSELKRFKVFLNPMVVSSEDLHLSRETNLSFPNKQFIIPRKNKIHVAYQTEDGHVEAETYFGAYGEIVQQMIEMLDGITLADYGLDLDILGGPDVYDKAPKTQKTKLLALYLENLKIESDTLKEEIESDPHVKYLNDTINFMTGLMTGQIVPCNKDEQSTENLVVEKGIE